jgi:two-component system sensor histidine kinase BaeS
MFKRLWLRVFLILLSVSAIALSSAFVLRELMVRDFSGYLEGQVEDRASWITTSLESTYEKYGVLANPEIIENTVWALMLGFEMRLYGADGAFVIGTESALNTLSPFVRKRIMAIQEMRFRDDTIKFHPYGLFLNGKEIGRVDLRFMPSQKELFFIKRSNRLLLFSLLGMGGLTVLLSIVFSRRLTNPVEELTRAVTGISEGDFSSRVSTSGSDEISRLSEAFNRMARALDLQESLRKKITANIAHELRTPVSAIRGELEAMMDGLIPVDQEHMRSLYAEIGRFRSIIEGLEELSRAEASGLSLHRQSFGLRQFLANISERYGKMFRDKGVGLQLECPEDITLHADPDRLSQVVINLLNNALKATEAGGSVAVRGRQEPGKVIIDVADTGHGIRPEDLPFVFERFFRREGNGLGLGLAITRELVLAHGGTVSVESEYGSGSRFSVALPQ